MQYSGICPFIRRKITKNDKNYEENCIFDGLHVRMHDDGL